MLIKIFISMLEISISMSPIIVILLIFSKQIRKVYSVNWRLTAFIIVCLRMLVPINSSMLGVPLELHLNKYIQVLTIISVVWLIGIVLIAISYFARYLMFWKMIKQYGYSCTDKRILSSMRKARFETDILDINPEIIICKKLSSPITAGITHRRIFLPSVDYTDVDLDSIFRHELVHCKHYDVVKKMMALVVCVIYWYCPFVWLMAEGMNRDTELSCDTEVVFRSGENYRATYGKTILNSIAREIKSKKHLQTTLIAAFNGRKAFLKLRIKNIVTVKKNEGGLFALIMLAVVVSMISMLVSIIM